MHSSSDAKEHRRRPCSAACLLFLTDQLLARYFWQIRDRGTLVRARELKCASLQDPAHTHLMTKYWRNLIWRCVHNPPNRQIKFPANFSGHTVETRAPGRGCYHWREILVPSEDKRHTLEVLFTRLNHPPTADSEHQAIGLVSIVIMLCTMYNLCTPSPLLHLTLLMSLFGDICRM